MHSANGASQQSERQPPLRDPEFMRIEPREVRFQAALHRSSATVAGESRVGEGDGSMVGRYSFQTFEEYVEERWEMTLRAAERMIRSGEIAEKVEQFVGLLSSP